MIDQISRDLVEPAETAIRDEPDSPEGLILLLKLAYAIYPPHDHGHGGRTTPSGRQRLRDDADAARRVPAGTGATPAKSTTTARATRTKASTTDIPGCGCRS